MLDLDYLYPGMPYASLDSDALALVDKVAANDADAGTGIPFGAIVIAALVGFALAFSVDIVRAAVGFFRSAKDEVEAFNDGYLPRF